MKRLALLVSVAEGLGIVHAGAQTASPAAFEILPSDLGLPSPPFRMLDADVGPAASTLTAGRVITYRGAESAGAAAITNNQGEAVEFIDQSTAGNATIVNNSGGEARFSGESSAGSAFMTNNEGSAIGFAGQATAAGANVTNNAGGAITFAGDSNAGSAAFANNGTIAFSERASAAQANIVANEGASLTFSGESSAGTAQVTNNGAVEFRDTASAGGALLTNNEGASIRFAGHSTAATAALANSGTLAFAEQSTAGSSSIVNNLTGRLEFSSEAGAGTAFLANSGTVAFIDTSSAGGAEIVNNAGGLVAFSGSASLGTALVTNAGVVDFAGSSTAGQGIIVTGSGGTTLFREQASGGLAALETDLGGVVDFSGVTATNISVGSIKGPGSYMLGGVQLIVGGNGLSTTVDGIIADGGAAGGAGGSLVKEGTGTLTLSGANSYTGATIVRAGVLQAGAAGGFATLSAFTVETGAMLDLAGFDQSVGSLAGTGGVDLATATLTAGGDGSDTVYSGVMAGTGGLAKTGAGTMELAGISTYSGVTAVTQGGLIVSGSIAASLVQVGADAVLGGTGVVGAAEIAGTLARATDGGTLTVAGDLTFGDDATYQVSVDATGGAALVAVGGTATLGGTLVILPSAALTLDDSSFDIISAATVVGAFDALSDTMPFIDVAVTYAPTSVELQAARNSVRFADVAATRNQQAAAAGIESVGSGEVYDAVVLLPDPEAAQAAFDSLSGEVHAAIADRLAGETALVRSTLLARAGIEGAPPGTGPRLWTAPYGTSGRLRGDGNGAPQQWRGRGILLGSDLAGGDAWRVGIAGGYEQGSLDMAERAASGKADTMLIAVYGGGQAFGWNARAGASYSWHDIDVERGVSAGTLAESLSSSYAARSLQAFGEISRPFRAGNAGLEPFVNLAYVRLDSDDFSESGGEAALIGSGGSVEGLVGTLGARASLDFPVSGASASLDAMAGWRFSTLEGAAAGLHLAGGETFYVGGVPFDASSLVVETGMNIRFGATASLRLSYTGEFGSTRYNHGVRGEFGASF